MGRSTLSNYQLSDEEKQKFRNEIISFFRDEMEQELGIIGTEKVLEFFITQMGDLIYNKALDDARIWYQRLMENGEADFYSLYKS